MQAVTARRDSWKTKGTAKIKELEDKNAKKED
jgi:hypothetical protein